MKVKTLRFKLRVETEGKVPVEHGMNIPFYEIGDDEAWMLGVMFKRALKEIDLKTGPINLNDLKVEVSIEEDD